MGIAANGQFTLASEDVDDRRPSRRMLRKLLSRSEGEKQELDVALVSERLAENATGRDGRLGGQIGEERVGRGRVSTTLGGMLSRAAEAIDRIAASAE